MTLTLELRDEAGLVLGTHVTERTAVDKPRLASVYAVGLTSSLKLFKQGVRHSGRRAFLGDEGRSIRREIPFGVR